MPTAHTRYDAIPYKSSPFPQTRPERLAAIAKLFGLEAPSTTTPRVLELGCGSGVNLIGMAHDFPEGRFVGIDLSARQIADGWSTIQALGLRNIELRHLDIAEVKEDLGEFDYIICHGVFSWVPPAIQNRILDILRIHLVPNGVGYVSYNTFPGWHIRGIVRDMMRFHGNQFPDPTTQLAQAKALVQFVADSGKVESSRYKQLLQDELKNIADVDDSYLQHEHLEENNQPMYFHEFARKLGSHGLQYLGESEFQTMVSTNFEPSIAETLNRLGAHDILQMEQYMDFVRGRYFRQSLICNRAITLNRQIRPEIVKGFWFASNAAPNRPDPSFDTDHTEEFKLPSGAGLLCRHPLIKGALLTLLQEWPKSLSYRELLERAQSEASRRGTPPSFLDDETQITNDLLTAMAAGVIEWQLTPSRCATTISEKPKSSALARYQAASGFAVTNLRGELRTLDVIHRQLIQDADGTRDRDGLTELMASAIERNGHTLRRDGDDTPVTDPSEIRQVLRPALDKALQNLARSALLIA